MCESVHLFEIDNDLHLLLRHMPSINNDDELRRIQAWMQAVISHPGGISQGLATDEARQNLDVEPSNIESVVTRSSKLSAIERLGVYGNAYFARLIGCMEEDFPATRNAVGEQAFTGFAVSFLEKYPSTSYSLGDLHRRFSSFLQESRPETQFAEPRPPDWVDFVIDLAALESTYCDVFDGPGEEQQSLLTPERLSQIDPEQWMAARLQTAESLKLLHFRFPVQIYASAVRKGETASMPAAHETWLAVHRRDYVVRRRPLSSRQFRLLNALQRGLTVSEAIAQSFAAADAETFNDQTLDALGQQMQTDFREWAIEGYFRSVE